MCFVVSVFSLYLMKVLFVDMKWIFEYVFLFRLMMLILFGTHHQRHPVAYYDDLQKLLVRCWNMITKILTEADSILSFLTLHGRKHLVEDTGNPVQCIEAIYLHTHNFALCFWCFANESTAKENSLNLIQFQELEVVEVASSWYPIVYNSDFWSL